MRGAVIYASHYGATRRYAVWIATELGFECIEAGKNGQPDPAQFDIVVCGGSVYAGQWLIRKWLQRHEAALAGKKLFLFSVSNTAPEKTADHAKMLQGNLPKSLAGEARDWHFPGAFDMGKLRFGHRWMMRVVFFLARSESMKEMRKKGRDDVNRSWIAPLVAAVRECQKGQF